MASGCREKGHLWSQVQFAALLLLGAGEICFFCAVVGWFGKTLWVICLDLVGLEKLFERNLVGCSGCFGFVILNQNSMGKIH